MQTGLYGLHRPLEREDVYRIKKIQSGELYVDFPLPQVDRVSFNFNAVRPFNDNQVLSCRVAPLGAGFDTVGNYTDSGDTEDDTPDRAIFGFAGRSFWSLSGARGVGNVATRSINGLLTLENLTNQYFFKLARWNMYFIASTADKRVNVIGGGEYSSTRPLTQIRFFFGTMGTNAFDGGFIEMNYRSLTH